MADASRTIEQMVERDVGAWSCNTAAGYANALNRWLGAVEDVIHHLKQNQIGPAAQAMLRAQSYQSESNVWFNQSNSERLRIEALVIEVKALRAGQAITYATGCDPVADGWKP